MEITTDVNQDVKDKLNTVDPSVQSIREVRQQRNALQVYWIQIINLGLHVLYMDREQNTER